MTVRSLNFKDSSNLIVMSFEVALMHLDFFLQVRGADGWSTRGLGIPSSEEGFEGFTFTAGVSKHLEGQAPVDEPGRLIEGASMKAEKSGSKLGEGRVWEDRMCRVPGDSGGTTKLGESIGSEPMSGGAELCRGSETTGGLWGRSGPVEAGDREVRGLEEKLGLSKITMSGKGSSE